MLLHGGDPVIHVIMQVMVRQVWEGTQLLAFPWARDEETLMDIWEELQTWAGNDEMSADIMLTV